MRLDATAVYPLSVAVIDERPYILSGEKRDNFIGLYRGSFGEPHDALMEGGTSLAQVIERDLKADLRSAGFAVMEGNAERLVEVSVQEYKYDCYVNCRVWHSLHVRIKDPSGTTLYEADVEDKRDVMGGSFSGYKPALSKELPKIYAKMIRDIVLSSPGAMAVLKRPG